MKSQVKHLYEKMIDFKHFGMVLLAVGSFFYLGVIIPSDKSVIDLNIMMAASTLFLSLSIYFFMESKRYSRELSKQEEE